MWLRRKWWQVFGIGVLGVLVVGRWLAVSSAHRLWWEAVGGGTTHRAIASLQQMLLVTAFAAALVWCVGNFYLAYRSVGAVRVPRRLGNLEISEALPRRYLMIAAILFGVLLALALSHGADEWWHARALAGLVNTVGVADPILQRDASFYLFVLPWQRTVHSFVTVLSGIVLGVVAVLYAAVGAVRWQERHVRVTPLARRHLGGLLAAFALALVWGYRLEPMEYIAGIHNVPLDDVLVGVRLPAARILSIIALVAATASIAWIWIPRAVLVVVPWIVLGVVSFFGHYVVPAFAGSVRPAGELTLDVVEAVRPTLLEMAYGARPVEVIASPPVEPDPAILLREGPRLSAVPVWDAFAATVLLNRSAPRRPFTRFSRAHLVAVPHTDGSLVPVLIGVREIDLEAARAAGAEITWERVHGDPYGYASGAVAIAAHRVSPAGLPLFVAGFGPGVGLSDEPVDLALRESEIFFAPSTTEFAVMPARTAGIIGVRAGGLFRRLALAWALQSPKLVTSGMVTDSSLVLWHRSVAERLERYAPFAEFGDPYPVVVEGRMYWIAPGYVMSEGFAATPRAEWRGRSVRYFRSSLVGVVEASSGSTQVFLGGDPDPLSAGWAELAPDIVQDASQVPEPLRSFLRYPRELFDVQLSILRQTRLAADVPVDPLVPFGASDPRARAHTEVHWWLGPTALDSLARLRLMSTFEVGDPAVIVAVVEGTVVDGALQLALVRLPAPFDAEGPSVLPRRLALMRPPGMDGVDGAVRTVVLEDGVLRLQPLYSGSANDLNGAPRLIELGVAWGNQVARGPTLADAVAAMPSGGALGTTQVPRWSEARQWFRRLDSARQVGDWTAFGRAYDRLKRLLGATVDSAP